MVKLLDLEFSESFDFFFFLLKDFLDLLVSRLLLSLNCTTLLLVLPNEFRRVPFGLLIFLAFLLFEGLSDIYIFGWVGSFGFFLTGLCKGMHSLSFSLSLFFDNLFF